MFIDYTKFSCLYVLSRESVFEYLPLMGSHKQKQFLLIISDV